MSWLLACRNSLLSLLTHTFPCKDLRLLASVVDEANYEDMSCLAGLLKVMLPLSPLCSPFLCLSIPTCSFKVYSLIAPQEAIYGYTLDQPTPCIGSNLFPCLCYRQGPILSQNSFHSSVYALSACLLCVSVPACAYPTLCHMEASVILICNGLS